MRILTFFVYIGVIIGIIIGLAFPLWLIGWILFAGLTCCLFSHIIC
ncbi:MAG: hypothetical protein R3Y12_00075 [Clostridia bacterium]